MAKNIAKLEDMEYVINPKTGKEIDMRKLLKEQNRAKAALCGSYPFFSRLADMLTPIYTWSVPTQATDGTRLFVNPEFTDNLDLEGKIFVLAHEIMHCALDHMARAKMHGHEHRRSNIAGDYEINGLLAQDGMIDGSTITNKIHGLYDDKFVGVGYERIYEMNPSEGKAPDTGADNQDKITYDEDFIKGYKQAIEDYKAGKIKL